MEPFLAEIRVFGCNYAPRGWASCNGQVLNIRQNTALFALIGVYYGGNGTTTFALPNIQGLATMQWGQGTGLSYQSLGQTGGQPTVTLAANQMPGHNHTPVGSTPANSSSPAGLTWANPGGRTAPNYFATALGTAQNMSPQALGNTGGSQPHNNLMPYVVLNYCIALQGIFPNRS